METVAFEQLVNAGISAIPPKFLGKLNNVAIVVATEPTAEQRKKLKLGSGWSLFGLYEGVPQISRGIGYTGVLPDKITIFQKPIEEHAQTPEAIKELVKETVWHELAHHFGSSEARVRQAERSRRYKNPAKR